MTDRKAYMARYMREYRARQRTHTTIEGLTDERIRALVREELSELIREEVERAIAPWRDLLTQLTVNTPAGRAADHPAKVEPYPYWRPEGRRDHRCQAANRDGTRCKARGGVLVKCLDHHRGHLGEFASCKRHAADFKPHPSVQEISNP